MCTFRATPSLSSSLTGNLCCAVLVDVSMGAPRWLVASDNVLFAALLVSMCLHLIVAQLTGLVPILVQLPGLVPILIHLAGLWSV